MSQRASQVVVAHERGLRQWWRWLLFEGKRNASGLFMFYRRGLKWVF